MSSKINIPAGRYQGVATSFEFGVDGKGQPVVKITMKVADGPSTGQSAQFKNGFGAKAVKWTKRALIALGWTGKDISTAKDDIARAKKSVEFEVTISEYEGDSWSSVRSIGPQGDPLKPIDKSTLADVNGWLAEAGETGGGDSDIPF